LHENMSVSDAMTIDFVQGSSIRARLLGLLALRPHTPTELAAIESKHVSHVSRALTELKSKGLVESVHRGSRERYYRITSQGYAVYAAIALRNAR
jgi:DNA-binding transcriptional ArsR family regulator